LVFFSLMHNVRPPVEGVSGALALAQQLPEEEPRQTLAALIGLGQCFLQQHELDALLEGLMATNLGELLLDQGRAAGKREDVLKVLTKRFSAAPPTLAEQLLQVSDVEALGCAPGRSPCSAKPGRVRTNPEQLLDPLASMRSTW
jgi:hypothetical protein